MELITMFMDKNMLKISEIITFVFLNVTFPPKSMSQFSTISKPPWIYAANNTPCMILFLYKHRNTRFKQNA